MRGSTSVPRILDFEPLQRFKTEGVEKLGAGLSPTMGQYRLIIIIKITVS